MRADQRAWIKIKGPELPAELSDGKEFSATLHMQNIGKTPARDVNATSVVVMVDIEASPKLRYDVPQQASYGGVLWPQDPRDVPLVMLDASSNPVLVSREMRESLLEGKTYVVVYGKVDYLDVFKIRRQTRFCGWRIYKPGIPVDAKNCTDYNGIGESD